MAIPVTNVQKKYNGDKLLNEDMIIRGVSEGIEWGTASLEVIEKFLDRKLDPFNQFLH